MIAHHKLQGLDGTRVLAAVEPVLAAHHVEGVELVWRTDQGGWLLELTLERPGSRVPGEGVTVELCSDVSRDLSAALDVADCIQQHYRLEVGSPGLERSLHVAADYQRFAGQLAKVKLRAPVDGQRVLAGTLHGVSDDGRIQLSTERGLIDFAFADVESARLMFAFGAAAKGTAARGSGNKQGYEKRRGQSARRHGDR